MAIPFAGTLGVLLVIAIGGIILTGEGNGYISKHIPSSFPAYSSKIGNYVPADAVQVSYNNFTAIRGINASALQRGNYLTLAQPTWNISSLSITERVSVTLKNPNATVDITFLNGAALQGLSSALNASSAQRITIGHHDLFLTNEVSNGKLTQAWVATIPSSQAFLVSVGNYVAKNAVASVLAVYDGSGSSLLGSDSVQRLLYAANGTDRHLGLAIQNFPGAVRTGEMTLITVDRTGSRISLNYFVHFANVTLAQSQTGYFAKVYLGATRFVSFDEILAATQFQPISALHKTIIAVG